MNTFLLTLAALATAWTTETNEMVVRTDKPGAEIQPTMYGLFFEDINYAADGGLYAELVKNRSFEFPQTLMGWSTFGNVSVLDDGPFSRNPHYVRLENPGHKERRTGLENEGYFGVAFRQGESYRFSVWARVPSGQSGRIKVELIDPDTMEEEQAMATQTIDIKGTNWAKYTAVLTPKQTEAKGRLRIFLDSPEGVDLEHVSLFPVDTWQGHENGLRKDLAQKLADLKPGVLRFPGGCIVEGTDLETRYQWKNSVGPVENRPLNGNRWQHSFTYRFFPDYYQSYGLGYYEFFQFAEEIGAEPLPILSVGLACQFQNKDAAAHVPVDSLAPYIQDAIDLIEFANGDPSTPWGKVRAEMGHPEPFGMKYIGIGNEQWGPEYVERLKPFVKALRQAHPEIQIVGSAGPSPDWMKAEFDYLWTEMKKLKVDLVDEHYYSPESWLLSQAGRYDKYDRKGPKVFAGEYACHAVGKKWNHFNASLVEAAFMTGLERNADIVHMATYAPLLAHVEGWQWRPDLIWFNNLRSVGSASYYVQQLYSLYKGTHVLPLTMDGKAVTGAKGQNGLYASAVYDKDKGEYIVKVANTSGQAQHLGIAFDGLKKREALAEGRVVMLSSDDLDADNSLENPERIVPVENTLNVGGQRLDVELSAKSFAVYILKKSLKE